MEASPTELRMGLTLSPLLSCVELSVRTSQIRLKSGGSLQGLTLDQIIRMFKRAGTEHALTIIRGETTLQFKLKPRRST